MPDRALWPDDVRMSESTVTKIVHAQVLGPEQTVQALDRAVAGTSSALAATTVVVRGLSRVASPVIGFVLRPPVVAPGYRPADWLDSLALRGRHERQDLEVELSDALDRVLPAVVAEVLRHINLTDV